MGLNKDNLKLAIRGAINSNASYFGVIILNETNGQEEVIINTVKNMTEGKLDYYLNAYNDSLELKTQPKIKIVGFTFGNSFNDISKDLQY